MTVRDLMESEGVEECAVESTSIYRMPIWRVPEHTVKLHLVNPYFIKQLPVKKNDVKVSRNLVKLDQCIQRRNIRISNYILTTDSKGYRSIVKLILQAIKDASVLVEQPHGRNNLYISFLLLLPKREQHSLCVYFSHKYGKDTFFTSQK